MRYLVYAAVILSAWVVVVAYMAEHMPLPTYTP